MQVQRATVNAGCNGCVGKMTTGSLVRFSCRTGRQTWAKSAEICCMRRIPSYLAALVFLASLNTVSPAFSAEPNCKNVDDTHLSRFRDDLYQSANAGEPESQYEIGLMFEYGRHVQQSDTIARCWYEYAAKQQHADAQYRLAVMFDNGWGVSKDKAKAFNNYTLAARSGHVMAQHDLAMMYFYGVGTLRNVVQAYRWLTVANQSGNALMGKHLAMVASEMTPVEIQIGQYLAAGTGNELGI